MGGSVRVLAVTSHGGLGRSGKGTMEGFGLAVILGATAAHRFGRRRSMGLCHKGCFALRFGQEETIPIVMGHQVRRVVQQGDNIYFGTSRGLFRAGI